MFIGMLTRQTKQFTHTYDPGAKALPPTNSDRGIERKLAPGISYATHIVTVQRGGLRGHPTAI